MNIYIYKHARQEVIMTTDGSKRYIFESDISRVSDKLFTPCNMSGIIMTLIVSLNVSLTDSDTLHTKDRQYSQNYIKCIMSFELLL